MTSPRTPYEVRVTGSAGSPVLLLPGGAATARGFFPVLDAALSAHRVVELDRPGTGLAVDRGPATLPNGALAAADALRALGAGPAVVVGQSLGGAVAVQLVTDFPDLVSGLVLIDPTPLDPGSDLALARRVFTVLGLPGRLPVIGANVERAIWGLLTKKAGADAEVATGVAAMKSVSFRLTSDAIATFEAEAAALLPRVTALSVPAVLLTADRKEEHAVRQSHRALAAKLGASVETWPGAVHAEHLRKPHEITELVLRVVDQAARATA